MKKAHPANSGLVHPASFLAALVLWSSPLQAQTPPTITTQPTNQTVLERSNVTFTVAVTGTGPLSYQWQFNGTNVQTITTVAGNGNSGYSGDGVVATSASLSAPCGVDLDSAGDLYITDTDNQRIRKVNTNGIITTVAGNGTPGFSGDGGLAINAALSLIHPSGIALDAAGNLYIADGNQRIRKVNSNGIITTVAGNGTEAYAGDGGVATEVSLSSPSGVVVGPTGNLWIADYGNFRIRKVDTNGFISTVAGNGTTDFAGDGGPATNASLYYPSGVALDAVGNLFIADSSHGRVRRVDGNGIITTVAGNGSYPYSGDGGWATNAGFDYPSSVALDAAGNLFIADQFDNRIRKVDSNGIITTLTGDGTGDFSGDGGMAKRASLYLPTGLCLDVTGSLYFADEFNHRIRKVPAGGPSLTFSAIPTTYAGDYTVTISSPYGSVTSQVATLTVVSPPSIPYQSPSQLVLSNQYALFHVIAAGTRPLHYFWYFEATNLVESGTNAWFLVVRTVASNLGPYTVVVTNDYGSVASYVANLTMALPPVMTIQPTNQVVLAGDNAAFHVAVDGTGPFTYQWQFNNVTFQDNTITTVAGSGTNGFSGDGGAATNANLSRPYSVALDHAGNLFISDSYDYRIRKVEKYGLIATVAGTGIAGSSGDGGPATNATLVSGGLALDAAGNLYVAGGSRIRKVATNGIISTVAGNGQYGFSGDGGAATNARLQHPTAVAVDLVGNLYIADSFSSRIRKVDRQGIITTIAGGGTGGDGAAATNASLSAPSGLSMDAAGALYIIDSQRIRKVTANGIITTAAGGGTGGPDGVATNTALDHPSGVVADPFGNLFVAELDSQRIRKIDTNGLITTVAGNLTAGFSGDGGAATNASLFEPAGLAVDVSGSLYIADSWNNRIRKVSLGGPTLPLTSVSPCDAGNYSVVITSPYCSVTSAVATLTIGSPIVLGQPASQAALIGGAATFNVTARGIPPLFYLWYFNVTNLVQNGTNASFTLTNMSAVNVGSYLVVITNAGGSATSHIATLDIATPPSFTAQPASQTVLAGTKVTLTATAAGTDPFTYQRQFNGTNLPNIIATVAGNGSYGFSGDGGAATNASLRGPASVIIDAAGNLLIADQSNNRIRKVDANGIITTVAGNGSYGFSGDGGPAANARLNYPLSLTFDATGDLYFSDLQNNRIRKIHTNGIITTVAGNGALGYSGDYGPATGASLYHPYGVAADAFGNLYIALSGSATQSGAEYDCIRKVDANGIITTVAGNGLGGFSGDGGPALNASFDGSVGVAVDASGNLFIADSYNNRIRKIDAESIINTVAGNGSHGSSGDSGPATNAILSSPRDLALDSAGNLYIADYGNHRIRKVDTAGIITTVAGNGDYGYSGDGGAATNSSLYYPGGVALNAAGDIFIADVGNNRVRKVPAGGPSLTLQAVSATNCGNYTVVVTSPYGGATSAVATLTVMAPPAIAVQPASQKVVGGGYAIFDVSAVGAPPLVCSWFFNATNLVQNGTNASFLLSNMSASNVGNYMVVVANAYGSVTSEVATLTLAFPPSVATQTGSQTVPAGASVRFNVAVDGTGPFSYQWQFNGANLPNNLITTIAGNGNYTYSGDGGAATNAALYLPVGVALDATGNLYIADHYNLRVRKVDTQGVITTVAGNGTYDFSGDGGAATNASMDHPLTVCANAGNLFVVDNFRVRKVDSNGIITTIAGNGDWSFSGDGGMATKAGLQPTSVSWDDAGNLYIADGINNRIRKVNPSGIITTVAGTGNSGYSGDGGAAINANLDSPISLAMDVAGNLLFADSGNGRIRKVDSGGIITTVAGGGQATGGGPATNAVLNGPIGVTLDASGNLYIADYYDYRISKVDTNGVISTFAGNGMRGFFGDGGAPTNASLYFPEGMAVDDSGNLIFADVQNARVRKIFQGGPTFALNGVSTNNAGDYSVIITSPYGSVTSAAATLTVTVPRTPPQFLANDAAFGFRTNRFGFNLSGAFGQNLVIDGSTNLVDWTALFTNTADGSPFYFLDPASTNFPLRFYRARLP